MKLIREVYHSWGAEVVFITSNLQGNREMMEGCKQHGIPAFVRHFFEFLNWQSSYSILYTGNTLGLLN